MSKYRGKIKNRRRDKRRFTRTASKTHRRNLPRLLQRGGYRG